MIYFFHIFSGFIFKHIRILNIIYFVKYYLFFSNTYLLKVPISVEKEFDYTISHRFGYVLTNEIQTKSKHLAKIK